MFRFKNDWSIDAVGLGRQHLEMALSPGKEPFLVYRFCSPERDFRRSFVFTPGLKIIDLCNMLKPDFIFAFLKTGCVPRQPVLVII